MGDLILWATFTGAWLLVAGPLYQGSVELTELEFDREGIQGTAAGLASAPGRPSAWWWLLPPVMYLLQRRWYNATRRATLARLTPVQRRQVTSFESKSVGWFTVAAGATLLASNETWLVTRHYRWPVWLFWLLFAVMLTAAVLNTAAQMQTVRSENSRSLSLTEGGSTAERSACSVEEAASLTGLSRDLPQAHGNADQVGHMYERHQAHIRPYR